MGIEINGFLGLLVLVLVAIAVFAAYGLVLGGLIVIGLGIAAAMSEHVAMALLASSAGLLSVVLGATRHREATAH